MSGTTFLPSEPLWQTLTERVRAARHVDAAIAYFGTGGAQLLPLRRGHRLVVDMSHPTVKGGGTDPNEIAKLIRRGVQAFTRRNLHAKVVVADNWVLAGSANTSRHSRDVLDEAALATIERAAVRRAREFIDQMCIEPIRPEYLEQCQQLYRPPKWGSPAMVKRLRREPNTRSSGWLAYLRARFRNPSTRVMRREKLEPRNAYGPRRHRSRTIFTGEPSRKWQMSSSLAIGS